MAKVLMATDIPADEVDDIKAAFEVLGATVKVEKQPDGTFTIEGTFPDA